MAIEKRTINGVDYGYDPIMKSYSKWPKDGLVAAAAPANRIDGADYTVAQLVNLAEEQGVELGDSTRKDDILAKINAHLAGRAY